MYIHISVYIGLQQGRRVDALDHRGQWFSGTIADRWRVSTEDLQELTKPGKEKKIKKRNSKGSIDGGLSSPGRLRTYSDSREGLKDKMGEKDRNRGPKAVGWHLRIHFDNFSEKWDEWYSKADFEDGRIARVYTNSPRKLKIVDVLVVQRALSLKHDDHHTPAPDPGSPDSNQEISNLLNVKIFGYPIILQCESYRSCEHLYRLVCEQSLRYLGSDVNYMQNIVQKLIDNHIDKMENEADSSADISHSNLPFTIR